MRSTALCVDALVYNDPAYTQLPTPRSCTMHHPTLHLRGGNLPAAFALPVFRQEVRHGQTV